MMANNTQDAASREHLISGTDLSFVSPSFLRPETNPVDDFWPRNRNSTGDSVFENDSVVENGRLYQGYKQGKYMLPNDGEEQDRLDMQHAAIDLLLDGKLAWAPVSEPAHVLDIGTGTGIWAMEYATQHPSSQVVGSDLSLIQPSDKAPPNCSFVREDAEDDSWTLAQQFDYIHLRMMFTCFDNPGKVLANIFHHLRPGGWVEFQDMSMEVMSFDGSTAGSSLEKWSQLMLQGGAAVGRDLVFIKHYKMLLEAAGFVDVQQTIVPFPCSQWPDEPKFRDAGAFTQLIWGQPGAMEGASLKLLQAAGLTSTEIKELVAGARRDTQNRNIHGFGPFYVIFGRKPHVGEDLK